MDTSQFVGGRYVSEKTVTSTVSTANVQRSLIFPHSLEKNAVLDGMRDGLALKTKEKERKRKSEREA